jgi:hypothetical protein
MREHSVKLDRLPEGMTFPAELHDRVLYDAARRRLVFRGFMTKSDYDRLAKLSKDFQYERGVEDLFVAAGYEGERRWPRVVLGIGGILCLVAITAAIWYFRHS